MPFGVVVLGCGGLGACWVVFVAARGRCSGASLGSDMCAEGHRCQLHGAVCCEGSGGSGCEWWTLALRMVCVVACGTCGFVAWRVVLRWPFRCISQVVSRKKKTDNSHYHPPITEDPRLPPLPHNNFGDMQTTFMKPSSNDITHTSTLRHCDCGRQAGVVIL